MMVLHGEEMLREKLDMYQMQMYQQPQPPQHHERLASFSSDIFPASYPQGQMYEAVPVSSPGQPLMTTPSVTTTMEGMAALTMAEPSTPPTKTFKPMQMVFREGRRASASSTSTSTSSGTGTGTATTATTADSALGDALLYQQTPVARRMSSVSTSASVTASVSASYCPPSSLCPPPMYNSPSPASAAFSTSLASLTSLSSSLESPLPVDEQVFRRQQGISLNYRGDIHNPHNRGDHVPAHLNTSLFLMGLPPRATVGDLLRAVAALGPTGRVFAASVNPPDPARRLPLAAAKISFFTRPQAERLKAQIDGGQLVMWDSSSGDCSGTFGRSLTIRCAWNRDKKPPRQCVQASECRVLRIRGPADVVNFEALAAYFDEKFRYELQDVKVLGASSSSGAGEQTMEWRFASFQSQAIAAKMALNQERKMVRVEYGRDPCEWGEC
ncbi:hypothetical protein SBRCBS47491_005533 [Sporothrix bragantina]|uniref:RRM domain-containing protein n=1 Tax=Sporothrix bragantina TaxID=671064 RepID=A0ABP0BZC8_9PEZI